jgi:sulfatase maturation enzyme AslB (radical SAM superfamily)
MEAGFSQLTCLPNLRERLYITTSTVCNLRCRICAYQRSTIARRIMPNSLFRSIVREACDFGFSIFNITPLVGEVLVDPDFLVKIEFLEKLSDVESISFCTNFILAHKEFIHALPSLNKLRCLAITLYGYDADSFRRMTAAKAPLFDRMVCNLRLLSDLEPEFLSRVELRIRTERCFSMKKCVPALYQPLTSLIEKGARVRVVTDHYSNWGGIITMQDLVDLDIRLKPDESQKRAPCAFLFYKHTVLPDGMLNACSADDGHASMVIGNLTTQNFREIYSSSNKVYRTLVVQQIEGKFSESCQACSGYRSIYEHNYTYQFHKRPFVRMDEFFEQFELEHGD